MSGSNGKVKQQLFDRNAGSSLISSRVFVGVGIVLLALPLLYVVYKSNKQDQQQLQWHDGRRILQKEEEDQIQTCDYTLDDSVGDFKRIFDAKGTDKGDVHGYYRTYGRLFHSFKSDPIRLLEIGVYTGKSMEAWQEYFPNHQHIYGIGYGLGFAAQGKKKDTPGKKVTLYNGDQSDIDFLKYVCSDAGEPFDIIVDDGSHVPDHQQISLENLLDCLKPGGLYIIEDMFTSYYNKPDAQVYNYKLNQTGLWQPGSFVERVKKLVDVINREEHLHLDMSFFKNDHQIASINFEQNLVVFRKIDKWDMPFQDRVNEFVLRGAQL